MKNPFSKLGTCALIGAVLLAFGLGGCGVGAPVIRAEAAGDQVEVLRADSNQLGVQMSETSDPRLLADLEAQKFRTDLDGVNALRRYHDRQKERRNYGKWN